MGKSDVFAGKNKDKIKKKTISVILVAAMTAGLTACGSKSTSDDEVQRYAWPLGSSSPEDTVDIC